jgi:hypothetical protein
MRPMLHLPKEGELVATRERHGTPCASFPPHHISSEQRGARSTEAAVPGPKARLTATCATCDVKIAEHPDKLHCFKCFKAKNGNRVEDFHPLEQVRALPLSICPCTELCLHLGQLPQVTRQHDHLESTVVPMASVYLTAEVTISLQRAPRCKAVDISDASLGLRVLILFK